ncbi:MAG: GNAT family N-acetyltransferase [Beijerinckiaceae bacterium]|nr:GNAT family N-acetyltransferase [Beijerinckiaceae bacterium]
MPIRSFDPALPNEPLLSGARPRGSRPDPSAALRVPQTLYADQVRAALGVGTALKVEILDEAEIAAFEEEWRDLSLRTVEPNVFYAPAFALAAARHLSEGGKPGFIVVFEGPGKLIAGCRMLGLFPFTTSRLDWGAPILRGWRHPFNPLGTPLLDAKFARPTLEALFDHLDRTPYGSILFPDIREDGPFALHLRAVTERRGARMMPISSRRRAVLRPESDGETYFKRHWRAKKSKELQRLRRRLDEEGAISRSTSRGVSEAAASLERFFALEAEGWKGAYGSAMLQDAGRATFARAMVRGLAKQGGLRIDELRSGPTLIASAISLICGHDVAFWKIAYDERYARFSPGVLLTETLTREFLDRGGEGLIDSCAIQDHPMIDHVWHERMGVSDYLVSAGSGAAGQFRLALLRERLRIGLKARARRLKLKLSRAKHS